MSERQPTDLVSLPFVGEGGLVLDSEFTQADSLHSDLFGERISVMTIDFVQVLELDKCG